VRLDRQQHALAFYGDDLHLILFRPHVATGNYSAWGFHVRRRGRDGTWKQLLAKTGQRLRDNPDGRQHEVAVWRSRHATSGEGRRKGDRIGRKRYVRLRTSRPR